MSTHSEFASIGLRTHQTDAFHCGRCGKERKHAGVWIPDGARIGDSLSSLKRQASANPFYGTLWCIGCATKFMPRIRFTRRRRRFALVGLINFIVILITAKSPVGLGGVIVVIINTTSLTLAIIGSCGMRVVLTKQESPLPESPKQYEPGKWMQT